MIVFTINNTDYNLEPNINNFYSLTLAHKIAGTGVSRKVSHFLERNNRAWEGHFTTSAGRWGGTFATKEMTVAFLQWIGASSIKSEGVEVRVTKAERAEITFGNSVVDKMFTNYTIIRQYIVLNYRIDFYIPELNIAVEYDEPQHMTPEHKVADALREAEIKRELGCTFIRVPHQAGS